MSEHIAEKDAGTCRHCGKRPDADGDHSCPCPHRDDQCPDHPLPGCRFIWTYAKEPTRRCVTHEYDWCPPHQPPCPGTRVTPPAECDRGPCYLGYDHDGPCKPGRVLPPEVTQP